MSTAKPMKPTVRAVIYAEQNTGGPVSVMDLQRPLTPAQRRRTRHKNNRILGEDGSGKITPKRPPQRHRKPRARAGLPWGISPIQLRKQLAGRRHKNVTWSEQAEQGVKVMPHTFGNGDR